jgi:hypothetical protein
MRFRARPVLLTALICTAVACSGSRFFREYEYEEEMYLSLDGSATVYVNSSVAALNTLRGTSLDTRQKAPVDRAAVTRFFTSLDTRVTRLTTSRRNNRQFVHVRVDVNDVRQLGGCAPFAWSTYRFTRDGSLFVYRQTVGRAAGADPGKTNWRGNELAAFRLHVPSKIRYHTAGEANFRRGNILVWEQSLQDRLRGKPIELEARMDGESILYRTLWLFVTTFVAVVLMFVVVIWWVFRRGSEAARI